MGAIGEGDVQVINPEVVAITHVTDAEIAAVERRERAELDRRARRFRGDRPRTPLAGRTAVIIDDGIATGSTARAACQVARAQGAAWVVLAVPVAPPSACTALAADADEVICLETPGHFLAIGEWYPGLLPDQRQRGGLAAAACRRGTRGRGRAPGWREWGR